MRTRSFESKALATCAAAVALTLAGSQLGVAAMVSSVQALGPVGGVAGGNYQKPTGLLTLGGLDQLLSSVNDAAETGASLRGFRNQAQTFTISALDYPQGVSITAFVANVRQRHVSNNPDFGVRLYATASASVNPLAAVGSDLVSNPVTGAGSLKYPTQSALSTSAGGSGTVDYGTYIFNFDSAMTLLPGTYAWQFLTESSGGTTSGFNPVWWGTSATGGNPYASGAFYSNGGASGGPVVPSGTGLDDARFGLIGIAVPEPMSVVTFGIGFIGMAAIRRRMVR